MRTLPIFLLLFWAGLASAWDAGMDIPPPAPVVDEAGLLPAQDARYIDRLLRELKARSGVEISVYIASSLRDRAIEDFSMAVAEQWKLGRKKEDRALLFVIAPKERKMRFEVGYGLEGDITDAYSRRVLDNVVKPYFQSGEYGQGILAGLAAVSEKVPLGLKEGEAPPPRRRGGGTPVIFWFLIVGAIIFISIARLFGIGSPSYRSYRHGGWGGGSGWGGGGFGSGGGSSWGGGGGGFSGGGASSSW
jgi:uncharacterized protein